MAAADSSAVPAAAVTDPAADGRSTSTPTSVLITNGNTFSMLALSGWLSEYATGLRKVYVTYKLPSTRGNLRGVLDMWRKSGGAYTYLKIWANKLFPRTLRHEGLPANVEEYLRRLGCSAPVEPVESVNTPAVVAEVASLQPDYLVSFSATQRFHPPLIETPRIAAVNTHYGALPAYAGLSPYYWHLHNREEQFGVTLHQIVPRLDAGPIIEQTLGSMNGATTALELMLRMAACVSPMLVRLFAGDTCVADARPQPPTGRSYFRHPTREQVREFRANGLRMLDSASRTRALAAVRTAAAALPARR